MLRVVAMAVLAATVLLGLPAEASAQGLGGAGIGLGGLGGQGGGLGPPPAGVLLHQQYMQLYGLPTSFTQGQLSNGGGAAPFGGGGGYGGGYGGRGRYFGVNYQRNMMAAQAYLAAARYQQATGYGMNAAYNYPTMANNYSSPPPSGGSYSSFGMAGANPFLPGNATMATFGSSPASSETAFRGFGFASGNSLGGPLAPLTSKNEDKKEEKKSEK